MVKDSDWHEKKRQRCIEAYSSKTKMKSVLDWRKRIAACNGKHKDVAAAVEIKATRLSEYMRLLSEPSDTLFNNIENAIRSLEKTKQKI